MASPTTSYGLLERARQGDQRAFELLFERYRRRLAVLLHYKLPADSRRPEDIDDLLQEILAEAFRGIAAFDYRGPGSFFAWLAAVANHRVIDRSRRRRGARVALDDTGVPEPADSRTPSRLFAAKQKLALLLDRLDELPAEQRDAILLTKVEGLSTGEMAARLGKTPQAAAVLLHRALVRFRELARSMR